MPGISHKQARKWISLTLDRSLAEPSARLLDTHLLECAGCRAYAKDLETLDHLLRKMSGAASLQQAPISPAPVVSPRTNVRSDWTGRIVATRIALLAATFFTMAIALWQFLDLGLDVPALPYTAVPIPTPSFRLASLDPNTSPHDCPAISYQVRAGDSLASIASHFSTSAELIVEINGLDGGKLDPFTRIRIPLCGETPTTTRTTPFSTFTITPRTDPNTHPPG